MYLVEVVLFDEGVEGGVERVQHVHNLCIKIRRHVAG